MSTNKKNLFIIFTQHHATLTLALIKQLKINNAIILFFASKEQISSDVFFKAFEDLAIELNFQIFYLKLKKSNSVFLRLWQSLFEYRLTYKAALKEVVDLNNVDLFVFNDARQESQFFIYKANYYSNTKCFMVQDGIAPFVEHKLKTKPKYFEFYYKIRYGFFWSNILQIGDYTNYDGIYSLSTKALVPKYQYTARYEIHCEFFYSEEFKRISFAVFNNIFPEFFNLKNNDVIVFLPYLTSNEICELALIEITRKAKLANVKRVFLKFHPRSPYLIPEGDHEGIAFVNIPPGIPAECFFSMDELYRGIYFISLSTVAVVAAIKLDHKKAYIIMRESMPSENKLIESNVNLSEILRSKLNY